MDTLRAAVVVLRVAEAGSFAGAARLLGVTPAAVARLVGRFEAVHGARLFRRSTRSLSLTPDGERFLADVRGPALALAAAAGRLGAPVGIAGTVRVTAAATLAPTLLRALATLLERYPALHVELAFDDHFADLGGGRWDLAVRIAPRIADASVLARRLAPLPLVTLAAPAYLARHGVPKTPDDLVQHRLIGVRFPATGRMMPWLFREPAGTRRLPPDFALIVDGSDAARAATALGIGIAQAGAEGTAALIASGGLVTVLDTYAPPPWSMWMLRAPGPAAPALAAVMEAFVAAFRRKGK
ncbi:LysR family transcriptional regulator [Lichenicola cladoniae]|uniref:LysR family transcriptional regulator n=1 Tax=Lichenicola cladoniae TaxID=1484109 RepID=A0A6M8HN45_9PROT|nr:LysR family transcriptional regulator [Lichenicola cladoniae]NPD67206.1 LysR family transcriptional regulator [Acetobacteraceae bacterium]QKE89721.1 LysR family transcriptional regulator [Lichenicola cladoniae]